MGQQRSRAVRKGAILRCQIIEIKWTNLKGKAKVGGCAQRGFRNKDWQRIWMSVQEISWIIENKFMKVMT